MLRVVAGFVFALCVLGSTPSRAEYYINDSFGGSIDDFRAELASIEQSHERVRVEGKCYSACTVILSLPRSRICITERTEFGFHAAYNFVAGRKQTSAQGTMELIGLYQRPIFDYIVAHGGLTPKLILLKGRELRRYFPLCKDSDRRTIQAFAEPTRRGIQAAQIMSRWSIFSEAAQ
jgi:hypothetical protein